ncbi:MAG: hypothetical protein AVDCRST_MAG68-2844 [uncultured Gemmatimonadetes bacterium]|uniref:Uncharacterized protein n=1 Tax=uncultured Gemmatimonadota bacterium TaxID=203437 RepID=A0A6J4L0Z2_9BACT|nr:MAG: hypothetical protein AVDCRST_MAG68-2844 [uncultured Gemmatimonadota bacterium]
MLRPSPPDLLPQTAGGGGDFHRSVRRGVIHRARPSVVPTRSRVPWQEQPRGAARVASVRTADAPTARQAPRSSPRALLPRTAGGGVSHNLCVGARFIAPTLSALRNCRQRAVLIAWAAPRSSRPMPPSPAWARHAGNRDPCSTPVPVSGGGARICSRAAWGWSDELARRRGASILRSPPECRSDGPVRPARRSGCALQGPAQRIHGRDASRFGTHR